MHTTSISNTVGWILTVCGSTGFFAAVTGIVCLAFAPASRTLTEIAESLHDTYYIVHRARVVVLCPLLLCLALSAAIAIVGYTLTTHYVVRTFQDAGRDTPKT